MVFKPAICPNAGGIHLTRKKMNMISRVKSLVNLAKGLTEERLQSPQYG
jgi:hypothetical protein